MNEHGLTKENLVATLPVALQKDESAVALAEAIAELLSRRPAEIERLRIYPAIDQLDEQLLDILAYDFKVDWWDAEYSLEEKRQTLKDSWRVHKTLGTKAAVLTAISAIYPHTQVIEWFEYGGEPYHFRLNINITNDSIDSAKLRRVLNRLNFYKSLRSHNDGIHYFMEPTEPVITHVWAGCPGLRETMKAELVIPTPSPPSSEVKVNSLAGIVGEKTKMSVEIEMSAANPHSEITAQSSAVVVCERVGMTAELDMSATDPHGKSTMQVGTGVLGTHVAMTVALDLRTAVPAGRGSVQAGAAEKGLRVCLTSELDLKREEPHPVAGSSAVPGFCGHRMGMAVAVDMGNTERSGGTVAAHAAVKPAGLYQKFVMEVSEK